MQRLVIATTATSAPMGAQVYQEEVAARAGEALEATGGGWTVDRFIARSLRSPLPGTARLPFGRLRHAGRRERRAIGAVVYPRDALLHRMELELPPARHEVLTMHDTVAWRYPDEGQPVAAAAEELRAAAAVICVSRYTAEDIAERFGVDRLHVVHNGVDDRFRGAEPLTSAELAALGIEGRYLLHAGGAAARKNLEGLAAAWDLLHGSHPDVSLVLSGPQHPRRDQLFKDLPRAIRVGRLPENVLPPLMSGAQAVVVPSHHEGFGLPALEAMAAGAPVVVAATSSLTEVAAEAGVMVGTTGAEIAEGLDYVLGSDFPRDRYVAAGRRHAAPFTWERSAKGHAEVWRSVGG
ncbi:glycosyltransferase [Pseudactinotalea sp. Z1748]|uniref:glycosyltransferase n=1 Tax=Pseudactinotalea sp. Z1748 TaxID=3413027 RepID=UPI003C7DC8C4